MTTQLNHTPIVCPILVGREPELTALERLLGRARGGLGQTALVTGEAGVGKSRLVAEAITRARALGFQVMAGGCFEPDRALPYAGLLDLLRAQLGALAPEEAVAALGPLSAHLLGLLPEYAALLPRHAALPALDPQQERQRITQAFLQYFAQRARQTPLMLLVEDLHWSDEPTLGVMLALARRASGWPLLLLVTSREEQIAPELAELLAAFGRERLVARVALGRLTYEQADAMLRAIFSQQRPIRGDFLAALYGLTDGNPFFIEEVLTALVASGEIYLADGAWERRPLAELHIPGSIQAAVQRRLEAFSPEVRRLAGLAAVAGRRFDFELLRRLTGGDETTLLRQIRGLIAAQLVVEEAPDRFAFRHALICAAMAADLLARERRALHGSVAAALEAIAQERGAEALEACAPDLAHHFFAAGDWAPALRYAARRRRAPSASTPRRRRSSS